MAGGVCGGLTHPCGRCPRGTSHKNSAAGVSGKSGRRINTIADAGSRSLTRTICSMSRVIGNSLHWIGSMANRSLCASATTMVMAERARRGICICAHHRAHPGRAALADHLHRAGYARGRAAFAARSHQHAGELFARLVRRHGFTPELRMLREHNHLLTGLSTGTEDNSVAALVGEFVGAHC